MCFITAVQTKSAAQLRVSVVHRTCLQRKLSVAFAPQTRFGISLKAPAPGIADAKANPAAHRVINLVEAA
jgi:hypothetical protein